MAVSMLGWSEAELLGAEAHSLFHHTRSDGSRCEHGCCAVSAVLADGRVRHGRNELYWRKDGTSFPVDVTVAPVAAGGLVTGAVVVFRDDTERQRLESQQRLAARVFESSQDGIAIADRRHRILSRNSALIKLFGYRSEELAELRLSDLLPGLLVRGQIRSIFSALRSQGSWEGEIVAVRKSCDLFPAWVSISCYRDADGGLENYIILFSDLTEKKEALDRIEYLSRYDPMTGLPNQKMLKDYFEVARQVADRGHHGMALLCCNLDNFKHINDTLGHADGDQVLKQVAKRLQGCIAIGTGDIVSRSAGDEFLILLVDVPARDAIDASIFAIRSILSVPIDVGGFQVSVTASFGVSRYPQDSSSFELMFQEADAAVYHAKQGGRNTVKYFTTSMIDYANERIVLKNDLRLAINNDELLLHYQPLIELQTGRLVGGEALVRWQSPKHGFIPPGRFIPIAEETGLIVPIGYWVLKTVCRQGAAWRRAGHPELKLAVNISAIQLRSDRFVEKIQDLLAETGFPPECLELELTESVLISDADQTLEVIHELKNIGLHLSIDDFGTGYSCLSYLTKLRTDKLKIDRSFVTDATTNPDSEAIITTIIQMARSMNMTTLAEGVETEAQALFLKSKGCRECQGYFFGRPVPLEDFTEIISARKAIPKLAS
jgi:diguanylate cyclase (GGDEF)-like protein/PAS domain S-box-containing protein